jgi:hypothetical protein
VPSARDRAGALAADDVGSTVVDVVCRRALAAEWGALAADELRSRRPFLFCSSCAPRANGRRRVTSGARRQAGWKLGGSLGVESHAFLLLSSSLLSHTGAAAHNKTSSLRCHHLLYLLTFAPVRRVFPDHLITLSKNELVRYGAPPQEPLRPSIRGGVVRGGCASGDQGAANS